MHIEQAKSSMQERREQMKQYKKTIQILLTMIILQREG